MTTKELKSKTMKEQVEFIVDKLGHGTLFGDNNATIEVLREFDDLVKLVRGINLAFPNTSDSDLVDKVLSQLSKTDKMKLVIKNGDSKKVIKVKEILAEYDDIIVIRK
jgi:hypothetical protein